MCSVWMRVKRLPYGIHIHHCVVLGNKTLQMENNWWGKIAEDLQFAAVLKLLGLSMQACVLFMGPKPLFIMLSYCSWAQNHLLNSSPLL